MKIISILKKSIILLSLLPIVSIYAYDPSHLANREIAGKNLIEEEGNLTGQEAKKAGQLTTMHEDIIEAKKMVVVIVVREM